MSKRIQMSESLELGIVLAVAGGFMDAYSYLCRGEVFANAQTGNMLLLGIHLSQGQFSAALRYLCPVLAFAVGIALAAFGKNLEEHTRLHWRQIVLLCEAVTLLAVSFMPTNMNLLANSLTSLGCGIQVQAFRKIRGNGIATTMCIGNLRSGTQYWCEYFQAKNPGSRNKAMLYYGIILFFIIGAIIGNLFVRRMGVAAIRVNTGILLFAFVMMFFEREESGESC